MVEVPTLFCLVILLGLLLFLVAIVQNGSLLATPALCFASLQAAFLVGLITAADWSNDFHLKYTLLSLSALGLFILGTVVGSALNRFSAGTELRSFKEAKTASDLTLDRRTLVYGLTFACTVIGLVFVQRVGYHTFWSALKVYLTLGEPSRTTFSALRAGSTRSTYVAAGYAAQFTAVILPALALVLYFHGRHAKRPRFYLPALFLTAISVFAVTATGGRKYLLQIGLTFVLLALPTTSPFRQDERPTRALVRTSILIVILLYGVSTALQGRLDEGGAFGQTGPRILESVYNRISGDYSSNQLKAMEALQQETPVWGSEWAETLKHALPGSTNRIGLSFENRIHGIIYPGNTDGNIPLNIWGSLYYNWGAWGLLGIPPLLGIVYQSISIRLLIRKRKTLMRVVLLSIAGYRLAFVRDPYSLLLEGGLTLMGLYVVARSLAYSQQDTSNHGALTNRSMNRRRPPNVAGLKGPR